MHAKIPATRRNRSWAATKRAHFPATARVLEPVPAESAPTKDHFMRREGLEFAGIHLIADFWGASGLADVAIMEQALRDAVEAAQATLLHVHLHHFGDGAGVSGVAVLAESHISVHTWPERDFAAFDIFMCGDSRPHEALRVLSNVFTPQRTEIVEELRGKIPSPLSDA
ncbi:MAG: adenosylmethionine decarboxylase [Gammaproteobacteria bacterium]|nr:adenosylmethionine decarboxylase [Gammaproteobacteria bacterium]